MRGRFTIVKRNDVPRHSLQVSATSMCDTPPPTRLCDLTGPGVTFAAAASACSHPVKCVRFALVHDNPRRRIDGATRYRRHRLTTSSSGSRPSSCRWVSGYSHAATGNTRDGRGTRTSPHAAAGVANGHGSRSATVSQTLACLSLSLPGQQSHRLRSRAPGRPVQPAPWLRPCRAVLEK